MRRPVPRPPSPVPLLFLLLASLAGAQPTRLAAGRFVDAAEHPVIARWAFGLSRPGDLEAYRAAGFNVVYIDLPAADAAGAQQAARLAEAAKQAGFPVIVCLNVIDGVAPGGLLSLDRPDVLSTTARWLADVVSTWKDTPGLLGWALQEDVEERLAWSDEGFGQFLERIYKGDVGRLNQLWGVKLKDLSAATPALAAQVSAARPGGLGRPVMDLARWRAEGVEVLLRSWTSTIAALDPAHPVIGGRMDRFRTLLAAPRELAALQPAMLPRTGWDDPALHQPGAVTVASQAGRFAAVPTLESRADPASLLRWARLMLGRGAAGLSFAGWSDLRDDPARRKAVHDAFVEADAGAGFRPEAGAAVVLEPWCRGPLVGDRAVYGYGAFGADEPAGIYELLRRSSRHGPLDVLNGRDLETATLSRYGCLILPAVLDLSPLAVQALRDYVQGGGVLFADLGAGCYETDGDLRHMAPGLPELFGVTLVEARIVGDVVLTDPQRERLSHLPPDAVAFPELLPELAHPGSLVFNYSNALFPDLVPVVSTGPAQAKTLLDAPAAFFVPGGDTNLVATQAQLGGRPPTPIAYSGLAIHTAGKGIAAYCSTFIYQAWRPGQPLFDQVHDGLLRQRPLVSDPVATRLCNDGTYFARAGDRLWIHRLSDRPTTLQLDLPTDTGALYPGSLNVVRRPVAKDASSPVLVSPQPLINQRILNLAGGSLRYEAAVPIGLWPGRDPVAAEVLRYDREGLSVQVFGRGDGAWTDREGHWQVDHVEPTEATLIIADGVYPVAPGSLHRAEWWGRALTGDVGIRRTNETLTAGPDGRLVIRGRFGETRLNLSPVAAPRPAAPAAARG